MKMVTGTLKSEPSEKLAKIILQLLITVAVIFNILAFIFALSWVKQPFLGVLLFPNLIVADSYTLDVDVQEAGIEPYDRLLSVDGETVSSGRTLYYLLNEKEVDQEVSLKLASDPLLSSSASVKDIVIPLRNYNLSNLFVFFWLPYIIGLIYLGLAIAIYRLRSEERAGRAFSLFCVFVSIFTAGQFDFYTLHLLASLRILALPMVAASLFHLALVFPVRTRLIQRIPQIVFVPYAVGLVLGTINIYGLHFAPSPGTYLTVRPWNFAFIALAVLLFLILLRDTHISTVSSRVRQQTSVIFWGGIISFGPAAIWNISNFLGFNVSFSWPTFVTVFAPFIIFPVSVAYATLRYRLLDLDLAFTRGIVYALLTLLVTAGYFFIVSFLSILLQSSDLYTSPVILAIFVLVLIVFLEPLRDRLQKFINHLFLRETFDSKKLLQSYGRDLVTTPLDTNLVLQKLLNQVSQAFIPEHSVIFLCDTNQGAFVIRTKSDDVSIQGVEVRFGLNDDLAEWLTTHKKILQLRPTGRGIVSSEPEISREEIARLNMLNVVLVIPLLGVEQLLGWIALGLKKSGQPYTSNDLLLLGTLADQTTIALENTQLLEQANRRAAELEALQKISVEIQAKVNPDHLMMSVVRRATHLLEAEGGMVFLLQPDGETLKVVVSYNLDKDYMGSILQAHEGLAGEVIEQGRAIVVDNYHNYPNRAKQFKEAKFGAVMGVPLHWGGKVQGVLQPIHRQYGLHFSKEDVWLMEFFAMQSSIALEKSQLLQETQKRANQLAILSEVSMAISSTLDLDTALQRVMNRAVQILNTEAGSLLLTDPQSKELTFEVVLGPTGSDLLGMRIPMGVGIVGSVAQTGKPLIINDVATDPRWNVSFDKATEFKTKDILCVPMVAHDQVVGVIEVINKLDGTIFTQEESNLLLSFASQAAIAIENAQIFTRTDRALAERVQELQSLQMFSQELQISLELNTVLDISLTRMMDALGLSIGLMGIIKGQQEVDEGLYLLAQRGMPTEMGRYKIDPWPLTKGIMGRVARTGDMAWVNDITQDKNYVPKNHRTRSLLVLPVKREGRVVAVIDLESTTPDYFTSDDVAFVKLMVSQSAIAIENALLFEKVREANSAKTEFMHTASHELKIPMTNIKGYAKLLDMGAGGALNEQQRKFLSVITNNVDRMAELVNNLLDVSRIEAGRIRLVIEDVLMEDVVQEVLESVQTHVEKKKLDLNVNVHDDLPQLRADHNRMVQIVTNLVSNAYKYTPEGGSISVSVKPYNGEIEGIAVTVSDTGYGISEEDQENLFTNFFRSSNQEIRNEPGTGLGLSITKKMIESHGGTLTFDSELGKGTSFTFTTPIESKIPPGVEVVQR